MTDQDIEDINVSVITRVGSRILAGAKIKLTCGILLSGIRVYSDRTNEEKIFLSFPTRQDKEGNFEKAYFPFNHDTREFLTERVQGIYNHLIGGSN